MWKHCWAQLLEPWTWNSTMYFQIKTIWIVGKLLPWSPKQSNSAVVGGGIRSTVSGAAAERESLKAKLSYSAGLVGPRARPRGSESNFVCQRWKKPAITSFSVFTWSWQRPTNLICRVSNFGLLLTNNLPLRRTSAQILYLGVKASIFLVCVAGQKMSPNCLLLCK